MFFVYCIFYSFKICNLKMFLLTIFIYKDILCITHVIKIKQFLLIINLIILVAVKIILKTTKNYDL